MKPAGKDLNAIAEARTHDDVARLMGTGFHYAGVFPRAWADDKNPTPMPSVKSIQPGLPDAIITSSTRKARSLPEMPTDPISPKSAQKLGGVADADTKADAIFQARTEIPIHWSAPSAR
jgi:hypothetical protein